MKNEGKKPILKVVRGNRKRRKEVIEVLENLGGKPVEVYLDVDTNKLNGKVKINYCPFCGREL